ncbi:DUF6603 domain-containing protein [Kitasatospora sp. NPDC085879]|uniref:DUF6603 domain-containing protein n=1 Tax=Kitasatospora sp. NPDC085879 TaxID=3154769 RepID=UPI0034460BCC
MAGTAELLALELGRLLEPLRTRLQAGDVDGLFTELGLPLPDAVRDAPAVVSAATTAATSLGGLAPRTAALGAAVRADDRALIAQGFAELVPVVAGTFTSLGRLATEVKNAFQGAPPEFGPILAQLPERLLHFTIVSYLERHRPRLGGTLALLGLIESVTEPADGTRAAYQRRSLRLDRLPVVFDDPALALNSVYRWGDAAQALDAGLLLGRLCALLTAIGLPAVIEPDVPRLRAFLLALEPDGGAPAPTPLQLTLDVVDFTGVDVLLPLSERWEVRLRAVGALDVGAGVRIEPPARLVPLAPAPELSGELTLGFRRTAPGAGPIVLFGQADGSRLTAESVQAGLGLRFAAASTEVVADLVVDAEIADGRLVVGLGGADGFLATFLPGTLELDLDLGLRWSAQEGVTFSGGAALRLAVPLTVELGPLRLDRLDVVVLPNAAGIGTEARVTGGIALCPFTASVEGVGVGTDLALRQGSLGPVDVSFRFLAPQGLGLAIDAGPVQGGGFLLFDQPAGRYAGVFEVDLGPVGVSAVGILDTGPAAGGFALLVVLRAEFPPIQLGFGFALSSVGGLLALNRRIDVDALRGRFASGAVGRILAPEDPIRNAPVLLADLSAVFPPTPGVSVVGPTLQLSWAELVRFDLGVFVELPGPTKVVLLGSARAVIDNPAGGGPLLQIRLDIIGLLDFAKRVLEFDAVLVDSRLLEVLELSGGAAFRLSWGEQPYVLLSVGGFHPAYSPAPLVLPPSLTRIAMTRGTPTDLLYLRFEGYFAVTTNTLQLGAAVEAAVNAGPISARGFLGFDTLIRFDPFFFRTTFSASFRVRFEGATLAGVRVTGELSGPGPITFHGEYCIEILFFDICFEGTFTLGSEGRPTAVPVGSAVDELAAELERPGNLASGEGAADGSAVVEPAAGTALPVLSPVGQVAWTQSRAPLGLFLQRFEGTPLATPETVTATGPAVTGSAVDWFAPGAFAELSDSDALNRKAFERLDGGVRLGAPGTADGPARTHAVTVQQIRLPSPPSVGFDFVVPGWLARAVGARTGQVERAAVAGAIGVHDEQWQVHAADGAVVVGGLSESQAHQLTAAGAGAAAVPATDQVASVPF